MTFGPTPFLSNVKEENKQINNKPIDNISRSSELVKILTNQVTTPIGKVVHIMTNRLLRYLCFLSFIVQLIPNAKLRCPFGLLWKLMSQENSVLCYTVLYQPPLWKWSFQTRHGRAKLLLSRNGPCDLACKLVGPNDTFR
ncbi:hypothetical protein Pan258_52250 [Symmachiella dynata]|nr:hypothetical protein Pan258_52250 [Symmachiella dynata]